MLQQPRRVLGTQIQLLQVSRDRFGFDPREQWAPQPSLNDQKLVTFSRGRLLTNNSIDSLSGTRGDLKARLQHLDPSQATLTSSQRQPTSPPHREQAKESCGVHREQLLSHRASPLCAAPLSGPHQVAGDGRAEFRIVV